MIKSNLDTCLFIHEKFVFIVYLDDLIFWAKDESDIHNLAMKLRDLGLDLEQEEDAAVFLGVNLERDEETGPLEKKQPILINLLISFVGIEDGMTKGKYTPAGSVPLVKNEDGVHASGSFNYSSIIGILIYLSGHTRPYIFFVFQCVARYMFCPKHYHEEDLK